MSVLLIRNGEFLTAPKRIFSEDICCLCGFCFAFTEVSATGVFKEVKRLEHKRRLTKENVGIIKKVLPDFKKPVKGGKSGVCLKCYRSAKRVEKMELDLQKIRHNMYTAWIQTKNGVLQTVLPMTTLTSFKKSEHENVLSPMRANAPSPPRSEERSVYIPWSKPIQEQSDDDTESAPTGHGDLTSERIINKPTFLENEEAMDSYSVQHEWPGNDSMEAKHEHHTDHTTSDNCDIKLEPTDSFRVKQEHQNHRKSELGTNGKHNMGTIISDKCGVKFETKDSFSMKQELSNI